MFKCCSVTGEHRGELHGSSHPYHIGTPDCLGVGSQPACGDVQAAMENDILKHIMQQNWEVELFYWWALLSVSCSIQGKHIIIGALILFSFVK